MGLFVGAISFLVFVNLSSAAPNICNIKNGTWIKYDGFCYLFLSSGNRMSYYDAEDYCQSYGAHLVSIHSDSENDFILESMEERRTGNRAWIGLNLFDGDDKPNWSDGSPVAFQKRVQKDFPKREKCFMMFRSQRGWRPEHCALHYLPICKIKDGATSVSTPAPPPTTITPPIGYCPNGWIQFGKKCYKYFGAAEEDKLKYKEARTACWNLGFDLVSIHSMEEQAFLTQHLSDFGGSAWIGISYVESDEIGHDMVFGWVDNSRNDFSYWAKGHPPPGTWKYCGRLNYDGVNKGEWVADYCEVHKYGYICQKQSDPNVPKPTPDPSKCQEGFEEYRNSCYRFMRQPQTQDKAEETCQELGGHLLSVTDGAEQAFLHNFLKNESDAVGIGLENVQGTRLLRWTDKQPLYFSNWADGQPLLTLHNKSCVFMDLASNWKWNVTSCSRQIPYICKTTTEVAPQVPVVLGNCPSGESSWIDIGNQYCYHVPASKSILSWDATSRYCLTKGMKMVSLHSDHETKSLVAYLWRESWPVHLGLIQAFDEKSFMWTDGTPLNYTNWKEGEPSSWFSDRHCAAFLPTEGKWTPINCSQGGVALCRSDKIR